MKIEKKGNPFPTVRFVCQNCGCAFTAERNEYKKTGDGFFANCPAPECYHTVKGVPLG